MDKKILREMRFMMERLESPRMTETELKKRYKKLLKEGDNKITDEYGSDEVVNQANNVLDSLRSQVSSLKSYVELFLDESTDLHLFINAIAESDINEEEKDDLISDLEYMYFVRDELIDTIDDLGW